MNTIFAVRPAAEFIGVGREAAEEFGRRPVVCDTGIYTDLIIDIHARNPYIGESPAAARGSAEIGARAIEEDTRQAVEAAVNSVAIR